MSESQTSPRSESTKTEMHPKRNPSPNSNQQKDPENWVTADEAMTGAQASYLKTLCEEANEPFDPDLTKAEASERIEKLQQKTGRSQGSD